MTFSRVEFLRLAGLGAAALSLAGCSAVARRVTYQPLDAPLWAAASAAGDFAALNRLTYAPTLAERQSAAEIGLGAWIESQLAPESLDDWRCDLLLRRFDTLNLDANTLADLSDQIFDGIDLLKIPNELRQATLVRQVFSQRQVYELMVEFWTDHFSLSVDKGDCFFLKTVDDREVVRRHALGNFRDLLWASAHSPAMLVYLDNQANQRGAPNENYARELLELHTLGVDGGYTQRDVMELARCLTGWTVKERFWRGQFTFNPDLHDPGVKEVLGLRLEPAGQAEAEQVLELLAVHPQTARFLAGKLARFWISDDPPASLVEQTAQVFLATRGDLRQTLAALIFGGLPYLAPKYRRPSWFVPAALRLLNAQTTGSPALLEYLARLGQAYFAWPTPDGYPHRSAAWMGNLLPRWQFILDLVQNNLPGVQVDLPSLRQSSAAADLPAWLERAAVLLLGSPLPADQQAALLSALGSAAPALEAEQTAAALAALLAAPAFQWK